MARKDASLLGIDLHESEIRVVQVRTRANKSSIARIGRALMPPGAIVRGKVMQPGSVAIALRLLLNSMEIGSASRAVIGILGDTTSLRTLPVPPVPASDLPMIVAGEVEHYGIVQTEGGTHAYLSLFPAPRRTDPDEIKTQVSETTEPRPVNVTIVALEEDVIATVREAAHEANLIIDALEPTQYGMYRSMMVLSGITSSAFGLMINPSSTDIAIAYKGNLVAYRRIDVGSRILLLNASSRPDVGYADPSLEPFVDEFGEYEDEEFELNNPAVESLSVEVQRTLDYYQREFPDIGIGDRLFLTIDDIRLQPLAEELSQRLGVTIDIVQPPLNTGDHPDVAIELAAGNGAIYAAAYGLAVQGAVMAKVSRLDLFTKERTLVKKAETKRNFRGSIITSIIAILLGAVGFSVYGRQITQLDQYTKEKRAVAQDLKSKTDSKLAERHRQDEQFKALRHEGIPLSALMDYTASVIDQGTGLSQVTVLPDLSITFDGESSNQATMIKLLGTLQQCPVLPELGMVSFKQLPQESGFGVAFEFRGKIVSMDRIALQGDLEN